MTLSEGFAALASEPGAWLALITLITMEVVLGIDNLIFISILTNKLPPERRVQTRRIGIGLALIMRLMLLGLIAFIIGLTAPVITLFGHSFSWRDLILIAGGLFLLWKATTEIHQNLDPKAAAGPALPSVVPASFAAAIVQIILLDLVFSVDSIITAVGMTDNLAIMVVAVIVAVLVMLLAATPLSDFIGRNPTIVMLALAFLMLIGTTLIAEGFGAHISRGYIYAAMAFSGLVEGLNMLARRRHGAPDQRDG